MNTIINSISEFQSTNVQTKSVLQRDGSYRIIHITKRQKDESEDDDNIDNGNYSIQPKQIIDKEKDSKTKPQKKSFKISNRNGLDGWKRRSTKTKRLLFLQKTVNEISISSASSHPFPNDLSSSIISNNASSSQLLKTNKQIIRDQSSESDALVDTLDHTMTHDSATLDDLLARADQLETTVNKQEFNKIQPLPKTKTNNHRRQKRLIITCAAVLTVLILVIVIVVLISIIKLRYKTHIDEISKS